MLASAMALPKFIFVKSIDNNKYLCYTKEDGPYHARLRFSFDEKDEKPEFRCLKFEVEESTVEGMVHIRNCYNNKYLVRKSADSNLIVGEANEAEEDQSKWSCTLFKPVLVDTVDENVVVSHDEPRKIRLLHIDQLGQQYTSMSKVTQGGDETFDLVVGDQDARSSGDDDVFTVYDAGSLVILPMHIALMGHNNQYCAITNKNGNAYLEFKTQDIGAPGVLNSVINSQHWLAVYITNELNSCTWFPVGEFILAFHPHVLGDPGLRTIRLGGNEIAILCTRLNSFAQSRSALGMEHLLCTTATSISEYARLRVVEPVLLREVKDLNYNIDDARVYNVGEVSVFNDSRANHSSVEQSGSFSVSYTKTETMRWSDSVSITTGMTGSWSFRIPYIGGFGIELSREQNQTREWGQETTTEETVVHVQNLTIPPMTRITLRVVAMKASYDIPFTCEVSDTLTNGKTIMYTKTDGLFAGSNGYNYETEIRSEDL